MIEVVGVKDESGVDAVGVVTGSVTGVIVDNEVHPATIIRKKITNKDRNKVFLVINFLISLLLID